MLELLGTIASNVLSLPGVLGLAAGMSTRSLGLAALMGGVIGLAESFIFAGFSMTNLEPLEASISILVGLIAGSLGCAIRRKGTTV